MAGGLGGFWAGLEAGSSDSGVGITLDQRVHGQGCTSQVEGLTASE